MEHNQTGRMPRQSRRRHGVPGVNDDLTRLIRLEGSSGPGNQKPSKANSLSLLLRAVPNHDTTGRIWADETAKDCNRATTHLENSGGRAQNLTDTNQALSSEADGPGSRGGSKFYRTGLKTPSYPGWHSATVQSSSAGARFTLKSPA